MRSWVLAVGAEPTFDDLYPIEIGAVRIAKRKKLSVNLSSSESQRNPAYTPALPDDLATCRTLDIPQNAVGALSAIRTHIWTLFVPS